MRPMTTKQRYLVERLGAVMIVVGAAMVHLALGLLIGGVMLVLAANFNGAEEREDEE